MELYAVYTKGDDVSRIVFIKEGLRPLRACTLIIVVAMLLGGLMFGLEAFASESGRNMLIASQYGIASIIVFNASDIRQWMLRRQGYGYAGTVSGESKMEAQRRFFKRIVAGAEASSVMAAGMV